MDEGDLARRRSRDERGRFVPVVYLWKHPRADYPRADYSWMETEVRVLSFLPLSGYSYLDRDGVQTRAGGHIVAVIEELESGQLHDVSLEYLKRKV